MKLSAEEFLKKDRKAITFIGMSGVGKTYLSGVLAQGGWRRYSCDYEIGTKHMREALAGAVETPEDLSALSAFIGKLGNPDTGGLPLAEFKRRQKCYYDAECASIAGVQAALHAAPENFVHDSTGSLCEILDESLIENLGAQTFFIYLKASPEEEEIVKARAISHPKPLFFPPQKFEEWVAEYLEIQELETPEQITPDDFARWVFPHLFAARLPKYQALADRYGVSVETKTLQGVADAADFLERIAAALRAEGKAV
ncbi:MAG: hypothetical protein IT559_06820 [Alphaproteobacteria bacterium]|nr:hypothetical protein [Alphaproteobacteria bacterium]